MTVRNAFFALCIALWLPLVLLIAAPHGCAVSPAGPPYPMTDQAATGVSNAVQVLTTTAAPLLGPQLAPPIQAAGAAVLAILAFWQGMTHSRVEKLTAKNKATPPPPDV